MNHQHNLSPIKRYNLIALEKLAMGNSEFISRMVTLFLTQTPDLQKKLQNAAATFDLDAVARIAHKLKSGLDTLGISGVSEEIYQLERAILQDWKVSDLETIVAKFMVNLNLALEELRTDFQIA